MAAVKHARGVKLLLKVGDGASPEAFATYCSINAQRGFTITAGMREFSVPDCDDPDAVAWMTSEKESLSLKFNGAGMVNTPDIEDFFDWVTSSDTKNCQIVVDVPAADGGVIFETALHLSEFSITGDRGGKQEVALAFASDGEVELTANT